MKSLLLLIVTAFSTFGTAVAQDDETRQATGLPSKIGENASGKRMNISGRVTLETVEKLSRPPVIAVIVRFSGQNLDRAIANDTGFYVIRNVPRENVQMIVEVDGTEVVMQPLIPAAMGNSRFDVSIPWPVIKPTSKPGVISALVTRTAKNEQLFQNAIAATKVNDFKKAVELFNEVLSNDPKDFVAWTELGTVYFKAGSLDNAEACYFKAIEIRKDYFVALLNLGKLYLKRNQFDNAILVLSNAVAAETASADARHYLGESYLGAKKGSLAVDQLNQAIRLAPDEKADLHLRLAALYDSAGMKAKASHEYKLFLTKRPDFSEKAKLEKYISENPPKSN